MRGAKWSGQNIDDVTLGAIGALIKAPTPKLSPAPSRRETDRRDRSPCVDTERRHRGGAIVLNRAGESTRIASAPSAFASS